ncbi:MAG TPA: hypothetical protein VF605_05770 [Allosphingosinicella sp.]|jgi:hypothetical protein
MASRRLASAAVLCGLAACGGPGAEQAPPGEAIPCALQGSPQFANVCTVERAPRPDGTILIIRHPNGGFRRLLITRDGRGVASADGAARAVVTMVAPDRIEVELAGDRYRLPATAARR